MGSSTQARSIELYEFRISKFEFRPMLMYLFRVSFLTTLDMYKVYFQKRQHGYKDQEFNFLYEKLFRLYTIGFCNQVLPNLHRLWSEEICNQQQSFKLLELFMCWDPSKEVIHRLEICALKKKNLLQDQVQFGIRAKVQLVSILE